VATLIDSSRRQSPQLTKEQANAVEEEMQALESDPKVDKHALRLFMQSLMPCGHSVGNLLTCPYPPFGCVICGTPISIIESEFTDTITAARLAGQQEGIERAANYCADEFKRAPEACANHSSDYMSGYEDVCDHLSIAIRALNPDPNYSQRVVEGERQRIKDALEPALHWKGVGGGYVRAFCGRRSRSH
jgi:hypothetical protein